MKLEELCNHINQRREALIKSPNAIDAYLLSFDAHNILVTIHPWWMATAECRASS